jgi:eukaryotic-like serine/threonine-protein kinase
MLTGRPPFRAETALETMRQVISVEPVPPSRINASVPRDLETICLKCLDKQAVRRYSTAGELADDLDRFLSHRPIRARAIGKLERCVRWIRCNPATTGLAITGLALACLACVFVFREASTARQRRAEADNWTQRLEFVTRLEREGRFREARSILAGVPIGGSLDLHQQIARAQSELELAETLQKIRLSRGKFVPGGGIDYEESCRQYEQIFEQAGIGTQKELPAIVADRIQTSAVRPALIEALDDWAICATAGPREWILQVARQADPDPWRDQVRDQLQWADLRHLHHLAETVDIQRGGEPTQFLQRVHHEFPNDFWLNFELALIHSSTSPTDALAYNLAALAIRPDAASVHFNLGIACRALHKLDDAIFHFQRALQIDPEHSWSEYQLGLSLADEHRYSEALPHFSRALELEPDYKAAQNGLRISLVQLQRLEEAARIWESLLDHPQATHEDVDGLAELSLYLGDEAVYDRACTAMLDRFGKSSDPMVCERIGRACLLKPNPKLLPQAISLIDRALSADFTSDQAWAKPYVQFAQALSLYRQAQFESSLSVLNGEAGTILPPGPAFLRSMNLARLGKHADSQVNLAEANKELQNLGPPKNREVWLFMILAREASSN